MSIQEIFMFVSGDLDVPLEIRKNELLNSLIKRFTFAEKLHYCWGRFKPEHRIKLKIQPNNDFYKILKKMFIQDEKVLCAIDEMCIDDNNTLFFVNIKTLFQLLEEYYWELDEIYISDCNMQWLISVNHIFEVNIIGEEIIEIIKNYMDVISPLVIEYNEYYI